MEVICIGWNDIERDYPLLYSFVLTDNVLGDMTAIHLTDLQRSNRMDITSLMQIFNLYRLGSLNVMVYIYDAHFAYTRYRVTAETSRMDSDLRESTPEILGFSDAKHADEWIMTLLLDVYHHFNFNHTVFLSLLDTVGTPNPNDNDAEVSEHWDLYLITGSPLRYLEALLLLINVAHS